MTASVRRCYRALEPLHATTYFSPESEAELTGVGLRPGRMTYFAQRAAAMGPVNAGVVAATFYSFNPEIVARHIPRAWTLASPEQVLDARLRAAETALRRLLGPVADSDEVAEAAALARQLADRCTVAGRPLYAAHAGLEYPTSDLGALWHAGTLLREYRGDGHVAALLAAGVSGLDAVVTHTASGRGFTPEFAKLSRGWSEDQWAEASQYLCERGVLEGDGRITALGKQLRADLEDQTDQHSSAPFAQADEADIARLTELGRSLSRRAVAAGAFPPGVFAGS